MAETSKTNISESIKDTISMELLKPVITRVRNRLKELDELTQTKFVKEMRGDAIVWHNEEPKFYVAALRAKIENGVGVITYQKYKMDGKHKFVKRSMSKSPYTEKMIEYEASYQIDKLVVETIEPRKPIKVVEYAYEV